MWSRDAAIRNIIERAIVMSGSRFLVLLEFIDPCKKLRNAGVLLSFGFQGRKISHVDKGQRMEDIAEYIPSVSANCCFRAATVWLSSGSSGSGLSSGLLWELRV